MKKALKFLLVLSVFAAFLIGASTMAMAASTQKVTIGDSEITITSDKGFMVPLPGNTNAGVDVTAGYESVELIKSHVKRTNIPDDESCNQRRRAARNGPPAQVRRACSPLHVLSDG